MTAPAAPSGRTEALRRTSDTGAGITAAIPSNCQAAYADTPAPACSRYHRTMQSCVLWSRGSAAAIAVALLASCSTWIVEPEYAENPPTVVIEVPFPPPPARVEFVPKRPARGSVWLDGEWEWTGKRWAWKYGRWVMPPARARYSRWITVRRADGTLLLSPGSWRDARGREIPPPPPLSLAYAREESV